MSGINVGLYRCVLNAENQGAVLHKINRVEIDTSSCSLQ
jgi:hypothetical protein